MSKDIFSGAVSMVATACNVPPCSLQRIVGAIATELNVNLSDLNCSLSTAAKKRKIVNHEVCEIAKEKLN